MSLVGPLDDVELYRERSPLTFADRIARPLLVLHGDADPVVPIEQSRARSSSASAPRAATSSST